MHKYTQFEVLSNEIFFEIFDYLHALDIFLSFTSLNKRISSILQSVQLHIVITHKHCHRQLKFLSSYLRFHDHQVISIKLPDEIRDYSSVVSFLFNRHHFFNLQSCTFMNINSSTKFQNVIQQIQNCNQLVVFRIHDLVYKKMNKIDKFQLTQTMLMHESISLRSITLQYPYDYLDTLNYTSLPLGLTSFSLYISRSSLTVSVYSILSILRLCRTIRHLQITVDHDYAVENNTDNVSIEEQSMNDNELPILSQLTSFELIIHTRCDRRLVSYILLCMPNLIRFHFTLATRSAKCRFPDELLDGYVWKEILEVYVPHLTMFEFQMSMWNNLPRSDFYRIVNSFKYFVKKYSDWHMCVNGWIIDEKNREEFITLRTMNYYKHETKISINNNFINWASFETCATTSTIDQHVLYSIEKDLNIYITMIKPRITWIAPLFREVTSLIIYFPLRCTSLLESLLTTVNLCESHDDDADNDAQNNVAYLSDFVHLSNITHIEFQTNSEIDRWKDIQLILEACPNVIHLTITTRLLLLSNFINNPYLIPIFKQIQMINVKTKSIYFPSNFVSKFVQRFPSLTHIELQVCLFDHCVSIIDTFLTHLRNLCYIKIEYYKDTLLDDPFSCDYVIEKRRQSFPTSYLDEQMITVKNNGETMKIWLS